MNKMTICVICLTGVVLACASSIRAQEVVSRVKVHNPGKEAVTDIVVRGALPLPAKYDKPIAGLALRDGEKVLETQVSVFSTYSGSDAAHPVGRPEVVQLAARLSLPAGAVKEFDIVQLPAANAAKAGQPAKALRAWLTGTTPVVVEAVDVFGNRYAASALDPAKLIETRQSGPILTEQIYQTILTLVGDQAAPDKPALKKFLHVRAYLTTYAGEEFASLSLMIHNGSLDNANSDVYYREIRVGVAAPAGLAVWEKTYSPAALGALKTGGGRTWLTCPPASPDGKVFVMPQGGAAVLRLVVYAPAGKQRALAYNALTPFFVPVPSQKHFSWSNFATARYDSTKYPMPLSLGANAMSEIDREVSKLWNNPWYLEYRRKFRGSPPALGHAIPAGAPYQGATGGVGIDYVSGVKAAVTGHNGMIRTHVMLADRNWDRQWSHWFYDDGKPYTYGRHLVEVNGRTMLDQPLNKHGVPTVIVRDPACKIHADHVKAGDLLSEAAKILLRFMKHDDQHLCRTFDAVPAAYLACDPVSRDRLITLGAQACRTLNIYPIKGSNRSNFGGWTSIFNGYDNVKKNPHRGIHLGRARGWVTHAIGLAYGLSQDKQIRTDCVAIARADAEQRAAAQMPAGNVSFKRASTHAFKKQYDYTSSWEEGGILTDGARSVMNILAAEDPAVFENLQSVYGRVGQWIAHKAWNADRRAFGFRVGLRKVGTTELLEQPATSGSANFYMGTPMAVYYELTGDRIFIDRLKQMSGNQSLPDRCMRELGNWSYSLWLAQGGKIPGRAVITGGD